MGEKSKGRIILLAAVSAAALATLFASLARHPGGSLSTLKVAAVSPSAHLPSLSPSIPGLSAKLSKLVQTEASKVAEPDSDPNQTRSRLKEEASHLSATDLSALVVLAANRAQAGDARFLALYLVGQSKLPEALAGLKALAESPVPSLPNAADEGAIRQRSVEVSLRSEAIENIAAGFPAEEATAQLTSLLGNLKNRFLITRAETAMVGLAEGDSHRIENFDRQRLIYALKESRHE